MTITFEIPTSVQLRVQSEGADPNREAKEAYLLNLYRRERITHDDLSEALGLGFHQTQQLIKDHGAGDDFNLADIEAERTPLRELEGR